MKEEIEKELNKAFNQISPNLRDIYTNNNSDNITELVDNQNEKNNKEIMYRKELFDKIKEIEELGFKIEYSDKMSNEELEDIINSVQY